MHTALILKAAAPMAQLQPKSTAAPSGLVNSAVSPPTTQDAAPIPRLTAQPPPLGLSNFVDITNDSSSDSATDDQHNQPAVHHNAVIGSSTSISQAGNAIQQQSLPSNGNVPGLAHSRQVLPCLRVDMLNGLLAAEWHPTVGFTYRCSNPHEGGGRIATITTSNAQETFRCTSRPGVSTIGAGTSGT